jgi:hypothetical protein
MNNAIKVGKWIEKTVLKRRTNGDKYMKKCSTSLSMIPGETTPAIRGIQV